MPTQVIMPQFGESVIEGTLTKWLVSPGDAVQEYQPILQVNTDKVDTEIPSPATGILLEILVPEEQTVRAGTILARIGEAVSEKTPAGQPAFQATSIEPKDGTQPVDKPAEGMFQRSGFMSPVVPKIAKEHNLDLAQVKGSGMGGRLTKKDTLAFIEIQGTTIEVIPSAQGVTGKQAASITEGHPSRASCP